MWRHEVGCFEMLTAYFDAHEEQMVPGRSRRDLLLEILHTHEMSRLGFPNDDMIRLPYNVEQSQSFYVIDRSMSRTRTLQSHNDKPAGALITEPPPLMRPRAYRSYREPSWPYRAPGLMPNGCPRTMLNEGRLPIDVDEDLTVTAICQGETTPLAVPQMSCMERFATPPPAADDRHLLSLPATFLAPEAAAGMSSSPPAAPSYQLQIPTASPGEESGGGLQQPAARRRPRKRRYQRTIRRLRSTLPLFEDTDRNLEGDRLAAEQTDRPLGASGLSAERPRRHLHAVNYRTTRKRRARRPEGGQEPVPKRRVGRPPKVQRPQDGGLPVVGKRRGRRPKKRGWKKRLQAPPQASSLVLLPKAEVVVGVEVEHAPEENAQLTPGSVRKSSRLVGHQNPILERMKRSQDRRRRGEDSGCSEFSDDATPPPPAALHSCPVCSRQFKFKSSLAIHMGQHSAKRFECSICHKGFTTKGYCKSHEKRHLEGPPSLRCRFCGARFESKADRQEHEMRAHIAAA